MSKIRIKNFGAIKNGYAENGGWLDIKKVTIFIGNQGSGKSTIAKLISTFTWIEKALVRGDYNKKWFAKKNKLQNNFLGYHRLENYFSNNADIQTEIEYEGNAFNIKYKDNTLIISEIENKEYHLPQIMYVPAERNFISNVKNPKSLKLISSSLMEFLTEFENAKNAIKGAISLPINNVTLEYDKLNDIINIKGTDKDNHYKVRLNEASSGFQSVVPLYLVSQYLSDMVKEQENNEENKQKSIKSMSGEELERFKKSVAAIFKNENLTDEQRSAALSVLSAKFNKTAFINIVEEPEQNLFPTSQWQMLKSLLEFNNRSKKNKLIMTTHSPYIINYLTLAVKAYNVSEKIKNLASTNIREEKEKKEQLRKDLEKIVPHNSMVNPSEWVIYELDEKNGTIKKLENYKGLPSDDNYLNDGMNTSNELFTNLLEIEDLCQ